MLRGEHCETMTIRFSLTEPTMGLYPQAARRSSCVIELVLLQSSCSISSPIWVHPAKKDPTATFLRAPNARSVNAQLKTAQAKHPRWHCQEPNPPSVDILSSPESVSSGPPGSSQPEAADVPCRFRQAESRQGEEGETASRHASCHEYVSRRVLASLSTDGETTSSRSLTHLVWIRRRQRPRPADQR